MAFHILPSRGASMPTTIGVVGSLGALALCLAPPSFGATRTASPTGALQVMADVVLIESRCSGLNVDYGRAFAFLQRNGIDPSDIMPTGARRKAFDAAYRHRAATTDDAGLCSDLATERQTDIPGVFSAR